MACKTIIKLHKNAKILLNYDNHSKTLTHVCSKQKILLSFYSSPVYVNVSKPTKKVDQRLAQHCQGEYPNGTFQGM